VEEIYEDVFRELSDNDDLIEFREEGDSYLVLEGRRYRKSESRELRDDLRPYIGRSISIYGNSGRAEEDLSGRKTWGVYRTQKGEGEWAVDILDSLMRHRNRDLDEVIETAGATVLAAVALSDSYEGSHPEGFDFYRELVRETMPNSRPENPGYDLRNQRDLISSEISRETGEAASGGPMIREDRDIEVSERRTTELEDRLESMEAELSSQIEKMESVVKQVDRDLQEIERKVDSDRRRREKSGDYGYLKTETGSEEEKIDRMLERKNTGEESIGSTLIKLLKASSG